MNNKVFQNNRQNLMNQLENQSVVILFAGNAPTKSADEKYQFTPNRNFYYFSGIDEEEHILVIKKINDKVEEILFIKEIDEEKERWVGRSLRPDEAEELSGIKNIKFMDEFNIYINKLANSNEELNIYLDLNREKYNSFANELIKKYPQIRIKNIFPKIIPLRLIKNEEEVKNIKKAIDITIKGIHSIMNNIKAGMKEYELEAYYEFECRRNGIKDYAFKTIAATGENATILHYVDNNCEVKDGELILFDLGAQYNYYNADITRTFPVSGIFTERQKEVYNAVLSVNERVINEIKPGIAFKDINQKARQWIGEECIKLGLISDVNEVGKYYWHSIGHSLGLDTHDIDSSDRDTIFKEGMVWTVEPGIYIKEEGIGVRIEDDVLLTSDGVEVLTKNMIKSIDDIEKFMKKE